MTETGATCGTEAARIDRQQAEIARLQAKIDELMIEYCPDEMSGAQWEEWSRHQRPVDIFPEAAEVCAEAYQVVGSLLVDLGKFDTPEAEKILDNLSQHRRVHKDVLPWPSYASQKETNDE